MALTLYPWQEDCLEHWFQNNSRGIVHVVTGAGKTILALTAMRHLKEQCLKPLRVKIIVPKTFMLSQWTKTMLKFPDNFQVFRPEIGYYYGGQKNQITRDYMLYVINSARYVLARHILEDIREGYAVLLIADECHHYGSLENRKIFDFLPKLSTQDGVYFSLGLSATPQTKDYDTVLVPALGKEIYKYGFSDSLKMNTIRSFVIFQIGLSFYADETAEYEELTDNLTITLIRFRNLYPLSNYMSSAHFFGFLQTLSNQASENTSSRLARMILHFSRLRKELLYAARARTECVKELIRNLEPTAKIILFGERIEQADLLYEQLFDEFQKVGRYHSAMSEQAKKNVLNRYQEGELRILVSCRALDEGFDVPETNIGIIYSSTSVERQRIQRLGRILRRSEQKATASLYYLFVEDTVEEEGLFPEKIADSKTVPLSFSNETGLFEQEDYENYADKIMENLKEKGCTEDFLEEAEICFASGIVRADWLLDENTCKEQIQKAASTRLKNYWLCMYQLTRLRGEK